MRWRVYAAREASVLVLGAGAFTSISCIARLGDLRPGLDAGPAGLGAVPAKVRGGADAGETDEGALGQSAPGSATTHADPLSANSSWGSSAWDGPSAATHSSTEPANVATAPAQEQDAGQVAADCPVGTALVETDAGQCLPCQAGGYCAGGTLPFTTCNRQTWDDDADAATPCVDKHVCLPGQYVLGEGTTTTGRTCANCSAGQYSNEINAAGCRIWSECLAPESYAVSPASPESDRHCEACPPRTLSLEDNADACAVLAYRMTDGQVVFEAEHPHVISDTDTDAWSTLDISGISGGQCLEIGPDDQSDWTSDPFLTAPRLDYAVHFEDAGTYYAHVRGDAGANSEGYSDSCYVAVDGRVSDWYRFDVNGGTWGWSSQTVVVETGGVHLVSVLAREDGFRVDKVVISDFPTAPTDNGPAESALQLAP